MKLNKILMDSIQQEVNSGNKYLLIRSKATEGILILYGFQFECDLKTRDVTTIWYNKNGRLCIKCMDSIDELEVVPINKEE